MDISQNGQIQFSIFDSRNNILCNFSTKKLGNLSIARGSIELAFKESQNAPFSPQLLVGMQQTHGNSVAVITERNRGQIIPGVDGLITQDHNLLLAVNCADCVPLFFVDSQLSIIGIAHAGWRGTEKNIAKKMIDQFITLGSQVKNIRVAIGPHIGGCCYLVEEDRAELFSSKNYKQALYTDQFGIHLDLGQINRQQLLSAGILAQQIEIPVFCTSCQNELFFSYRKSDKKNVPQMLGIIGQKGIYAAA